MLRLLASCSDCPTIPTPGRAWAPEGHYARAPWHRGTGSQSRSAWRLLRPVPTLPAPPRLLNTPCRDLACGPQRSARILQPTLRMFPRGKCEPFWFRAELVWEVLRLVLVPSHSGPLVASFALHAPKHVVLLVSLISPTSKRTQYHGCCNIDSTKCTKEK